VPPTLSAPEVPERDTGPEMAEPQISIGAASVAAMGPCTVARISAHEPPGATLIVGGPASAGTLPP
jgi:hypothetical protein